MNDDALTLAILCDMVLGEHAEDRSNDTLIRAVRELMVSRARKNAGMSVQEYIFDRFGTGRVRWCTKCGVELQVVRPGDIRCPKCNI